MRSSSWRAEFDAFVAEKMESYVTPGMAAGLWQDGREAFVQGYGWRDREAGLAVDPDTIFGIGSCTKSITCAAVLLLAERGKLSPDDPVTRYLPEFRLPGAGRRPVTIHHLMTHTSGLAPQPALFYALKRSFAGDPAAPEGVPDDGEGPIDSTEDLVEFLARSRIPLLGEPGEHFSYSNEGYALLGAIVERVSGVAYETFVTEALLKPLGMVRSTFQNPLAAGLDNATTLYAVRGDEGAGEVYPAPKWWDAPAMVAAGFLRATVPDLLRYLSLFTHGGRTPEGHRLLTEESVRRMLTPHAPFLPGRAYGYGFVIWEDFHGRALAEHSGGLKGIGAHVAVMPEEGVASAALANLQGAPSGHVALACLAAAVGAPLDAPRLSSRPAVAVDGEQLLRYVGTYRSGEGAHLVVEADGRSLAVELEGRRHLAKAVAPDAFVFRVKDDEVVLRFLDHEGGPATRLALGSRILHRDDAGSASTDDGDGR
jgi:CubicO group peptidase (beta-lactamase class C family)